MHQSHWIMTQSSWGQYYSGFYIPGTCYFILLGFHSLICLRTDNHFPISIGHICASSAIMLHDFYCKKHSFWNLQRTLWLDTDGDPVSALVIKRDTMEAYWDFSVSNCAIQVHGHKSSVSLGFHDSFQRISHLFPFALRSQWMQGNNVFIFYP